MKLEFDIPAEQLILEKCILPPQLNNAKIFGVQIKLDIFAPIYKDLSIEFFTEGNLDFTQNTSNNLEAYDIVIRHVTSGDIAFKNMRATIIDYDETGTVNIRYNNHTNLVGPLGIKAQNLCINILNEIDSFQKQLRAAEELTALSQELGMYD